MREPTVEPELFGAEDGVVGDANGLVAASCEHLGQSWITTIKAPARAHPELLRQMPRKHARVRRECPWSRCNGLFEAHAGLREPVQVWRSRPSVSVHAQTLGAK